LRNVALVALLGALLAAVAASCGPEERLSPSPSAAAIDSGIRGIVLLSPTCAAQPVDASPCVTPYAAQLVIVDASGNRVAGVASGPDGRFEITLPPGDYVIQPTPGPDGVPSGTPLSVTVVPDTWAEVEIDYDTGIR
jgi:hypothetical protein